MKKVDFLKLIENLGDEDNINDLLLGTDIEDQIKLSALTLDNFKSKTSDKEFKAYLDSLNDKHAEKVIKTMKENGTWEKQFQDVLETKYPDLFKIEDPVVAQLKAEVEAIKKEKAAADAQLAKTQRARDVKEYLKEQYKDFKYDIPDSLFDRCVLDDVDASKVEVDGLMSFITNVMKSDRETYFNSNNPQPGGASGGDPGTYRFKTMQEAMAYANEHPGEDVNTIISSIGSNE